MEQICLNCYHYNEYFLFKNSLLCTCRLHKVDIMFDDTACNDVRYLSDVAKEKNGRERVFLPQKE